MSLLWLGQCEPIRSSSGPIRLVAAERSVYAEHHQGRVRLPQLWELVGAAALVE